MTPVEIGSSAEQGSSISSALGLTANARAIQSRCCCPPDNDPPGSFRRLRVSRHSPARSRHSCTRPSAFVTRFPERRNPARTFWAYATVSLFAFLFVWAAIPETKGRTLEQIEKIWSKEK